MPVDLGLSELSVEAFETLDINSDALGRYISLLGVEKESPIDDVHCIEYLQFIVDSHDITILKTRLDDFCAKIGSNSVQTCDIFSDTFVNLVMQYNQAFSFANSNTIILVSASDHRVHYMSPDLHMDIVSYQDYSGTMGAVAHTDIDPSYRLIGALKGPTTIFYNAPYAMREQYYNDEIMGRHDHHDHIDKIATYEIADSWQAKGPNQAVIDTIGQSSVVHFNSFHSQPECDEQRIFFSIWNVDHKSAPLKPLYAALQRNIEIC